MLRASHHWAKQRLVSLYLSSPRFWFVVIACVLVSGLSGPFHTMELFSPVQRYVYWAFLLPPTMICQFYLSMLLREVARKTYRPWGEAALAAGMLGSFFIFIWALLADTLVSGHDLTFNWRSSASYVFPLVIIITLVMNAFLPTLQPLWGFRRRGNKRPLAIRPPVRTGPEAEPSLFFDRLPADLGRDVISLRAANHHIEVSTPMGQGRVLMRLADAEADLTALPGLRVHRSWWVNLTHVVATETRPGGIDLILTSGQKVPVSRAKTAEVTERLTPHNEL